MTDTERAHTVSNGVDTDRIASMTEGVGHVIVIFVGTLGPWRRVEHLIGVCALASFPWGLRIIGDGLQRETLEEATRAAGADVDFRDTVAPHGVPLHLKSFAIAVTPYPVPVDETDHYFSPLKVYEYMTVSLSVVANVFGQIPVTLLGHGVLVPLSGTVALACVIDVLAQDPEYRTELGAQARLAAEKHHSREGVVGYVLELVKV